MTDRELVLQLLATMGEHARRARVAAVTSRSTFARITDEGWGVPASHSDAFSMLPGHRVIDVALADDLRRIVGVRNRIAHLYGTVDVERLWAELPRD